MLEATREACHEAAADNQPGCVAALGSTVAAGATRAAQEPVARLLLGRAQADAARSLALRPAENVPVYVMLPLDTVSGRCWPLACSPAAHTLSPVGVLHMLRASPCSHMWSIPSVGEGLQATLIMRQKVPAAVLHTWKTLAGVRSLCCQLSLSLPPPLLLQVNAEGVFRYAYVPWFAQALQVLALSGVHGVAVDVWVSTLAAAASRS